MYNDDGDKLSWFDSEYANYNDDVIAWGEQKFIDKTNANK